MVSIFKRPKATLVCMRLDQMHMSHPNMVTDYKCSVCGNVVGVYPSGQKVIRENQENVKIVCAVCHIFTGKEKANPEVLEEIRQSIKITRH